MSTQTPNPPSPPVATPATSQTIRIDGMPSRIQVLMWLGTTALTVVAAVSTFGAIYLNKSLEATESRLSNVVRETISPVRDKETQLRLIVGLLVAKTPAFSPEEKEYANEILKQISYADFKKYLETLPEQKRKVSLDQLIASKQVEQVGKVTGLVWADGHTAQIRYIRSTNSNPSLELKGVDFYSSDGDPCQSKNLDPLGVPNVTAKVCEAHLNSKGRLELIVVQPPEPQGF